MGLKMEFMQLNASAPGSLMLLGEYGVLYGHKALVTAINYRMKVSLKPLTDNQIIIFSDRYGKYQSSLKELTITEPFHFILKTISKFINHFPCGALFTIESEFSDEIGFGSSAALTAATLGILNEWLGLNLSLEELVKHGKSIIQEIQMTGSGADIAAAIFGGMIAFQSEPLNIERLNTSCDLIAYYSGFKTKTARAIEKVTAEFQSKPQEFNALMELIGECSEQGINFARESNWVGLGKVFVSQQQHFTSLGVNLPILQAMVDQLINNPTVLGAKISGSGLGDCVIGLTSEKYDHEINLPRNIPISISQQGLICEK